MTGIGGRLRSARTRNGLTQVDLAKATRVGLATIRRIEQANFEPRLATARKLAEAVDIRVEWLIFGLEMPADEKDERHGNERRKPQ